MIIQFIKVRFPLFLFIHYYPEAYVILDYDKKDPMKFQATTLLKIRFAHINI